MKKNKLFNKAYILRRKGYSLREVSEKLKISKSTASLWLSGVEIGKNGQKRILRQKEKAIINLRKFKENQKRNYLENIKNNCDVLKGKNRFKKNDLKIFLAMLFWGEGSKNERRLVFINSDPEMIRVYLSLLRSSYEINEKKLRAVLHLHAYHKIFECKKFWSDLTKIDENRISIYKKKNTRKRTRENYQGCISIRYGDVRILDELILIVKRFSSSIN
jgi:transcriptional regulator with XRE-family HTH domain